MKQLILILTLTVCFSGAAQTGLEIGYSHQTFDYLLEESAA